MRGEGGVRRVGVWERGGKGGKARFNERVE